VEDDHWFEGQRAGNRRASCEKRQQDLPMKPHFTLNNEIGLQLLLLSWITSFRVCQAR